MSEAEYEDDEPRDTSKAMIKALKEAVCYLLECSHRECDYRDFHGEKLRRAILEIEDAS